jgi:hypothetical protein
MALLLVSCLSACAAEQAASQDKATDPIDAGGGDSTMLADAGVSQDVGAVDAVDAASDSAATPPDAAPVDVTTGPCANKPAGAACDDSNACTGADLCSAAGVCEGTKDACDDDNLCTFDSCKAGACVNTVVAAKCDDSNVCTVGDVCDAGKCAPGLVAKDCDDGKPCTEDLCELAKGCVSTAKSCDDGNGCTVDSCDLAKGCLHKKMTKGVNCDDADKCTTATSCVIEVTTGDLVCSAGKALDCDDGDACTDDSCDKTLGCLHKLNAKSCDDGHSCTKSDKCVGGACFGLKTTACPKCIKVFGGTVGQVTNFQIGNTGKVGDGIDVDGDPKTCAPAGNCNSGVDNAFAPVALLMNGPLGDAIKNGQLTFVVEMDGYKGENVPFTLNMYHADLTAKSKADKCPYLTDKCQWQVYQDSVGPDCKARVSFANAKVVGGKLTAGGPGTLFILDVDVNGSQAMFYAKGARIEGKVAFEADGKTVKSAQGVIGGAMNKLDFLVVVQGLNDSVFPIPKKTVVAMMDSMLKPDMDLDGDGYKEAGSIGMRFSVIGAVIKGMEP